MEMTREPEYCRDLMEDILKFTGGRRRLSVSEVAKFEGRDRRTVQKCYQIDPKLGIDALVLAKRMCR